MTFVSLGVAMVALAPHQQPSAAEELSRVNQAYVELNSYMDWGWVTFSYRTASGERKGETRKFNTSFKRPNRIRYEFVEPPTEVTQEKRWITWNSPRGSFVAWTSWAPHDVDRTPLEKSFFRTWGMVETCGMAVKLLEPWALSYARVTKIYKTTLTSDTVAGSPCWRIDGVCEDFANASIWIDQKSNLIVRYRHAIDATLDGKPTNEIYTVTVFPSPNPPMSVDSLRFVPPDDRTSVHTHRRHRRRRR